MNARDYITQSLKTILEMLKDRNIETGLSPDGAADLIGPNPNYFEIIIDKIKIVYYLPSKFKWPDLKKSLEDKPENYNLHILVVKEKLTLNNVKYVNSVGISNLQIFDIKELQFNISTHKLVPKHELITDPAEVESIIKQYSLKTKYQLPLIMKTDAMAKYLNLKSGDIVKITRVSETSGMYITYRCCI